MRFTVFQCYFSFLTNEGVYGTNLFCSCISYEYDIELVIIQNFQMISENFVSYV